MEQFKFTETHTPYKSKEPASHFWRNLLILLRFKKVNLSKVSTAGYFSGTDLSECDFQKSDLFNARFQNTTLLKADFRGAHSYLIDPISNKVRGARFSLPEAQGLLVGLGIRIEGPC